MATDTLPTSLQVELITPEKILFSGAAHMVTAPGTLGMFGVLPGHEPFISTLRPGVIVIESENGEQKKIAVLSGIAEVVPDHCILLTETALECDTIDAGSLLNEGRAALDAAITESERKAAELKIAFAEAIALQ